MKIYEVEQGSLMKNMDYTGIILRDEVLCPASQSGYINYYVNANDRVGVASAVYTVDENGSVREYLNQTTFSDSTLPEEELLSIRNDLDSFQSSFTDRNYEEMYRFGMELEDLVLQALNMKQLQALVAESGGMQKGAFSVCTASEPGIVEFYSDGYENLTTSNFKAEMLNEKDYEPVDLRSTDPVEMGMPVYKLIRGESWSIIIEPDEESLEQILNYAEKNGQYVNITFSMDGTRANAVVDTFKKDGHTYLLLSLNHSMIRFAQDRYIDIHMNLSDTDGLKIPTSSVVFKELFRIPKDFMAKGGDDDGNEGFLLQTVSENGELGSEYVLPSISNEDDKYYYVETSEFNPGDLLLKTDSEETYQISEKQGFYGVYNISKGFSVFEIIDLLSFNTDYCIVSSDFPYSISRYDQILLDARVRKDEEDLYFSEVDTDALEIEIEEKMHQRDLDHISDIVPSEVPSSEEAADPTLETNQAEAASGASVASGDGMIENEAAPETSGTDEGSQEVSAETAETETVDSGMIE